MARSRAATQATSAPYDVRELMQVVSLLPDVLFRCVKRPDGKIIWTLNEGGLAEQFHLTTQEIEGKTLEELFPGGASSAIKEHFEAAFRGETETFINELGDRYFKHFPQPVRGPDGEVEAVVGFISEVTDLVRAEQGLAQANADLEAFAQRVSHDLRTPLSVISTLAGVLERQALDERGKGAIQRLKRSVKSMDGMITGLLEFSQSRRVQPSYQDVDLQAIADETVRALRTRYPGHQVAFETEGDLHVHADARLMSIVLANLLGNAWKYTVGRDNPHVRLVRKDEAIGVVDNGPGFAPADAETVFEPFTRLPDAKGTEGSGIGLATVRRIIERHGGRVWAESTPGKGAAFWFTIGPKDEDPQAS